MPGTTAPQLPPITLPPVLSALLPEPSAPAPAVLTEVPPPAPSEITPVLPPVFMSNGPITVPPVLSALLPQSTAAAPAVLSEAPPLPLSEITPVPLPPVFTSDGPITLAPVLSALLPQPGAPAPAVLLEVPPLVPSEVLPISLPPVVTSSGPPASLPAVTLPLTLPPGTLLPAVTLPFTLPPSLSLPVLTQPALTLPTLTLPPVTTSHVTRQGQVNTTLAPATQAPAAQQAASTLCSNTAGTRALLMHMSLVLTLTLVVLPCKALRHTHFVGAAETYCRYGVCFCSVVTTDSAEPPTIQLRHTGYLASNISVVQGYPYAACGSRTLPTRAAPCELGANATSAAGLNLTQYVVACKPANCSTAGCNGESHSSGLHRCKSNMPMQTSLARAWPPSQHATMLQAKPSTKRARRTASSTPASPQALCSTSHSLSWSPAAQT